MKSAVYEGIVRHRRLLPHAHTFKYRMAQLFLDLDELDTVFREHDLWSVDSPNLAEFRRSDYLGPPELSLTEAVRRQVTHREPAHVGRGGLAGPAGHVVQHAGQPGG